MPRNLNNLALLYRDMGNWDAAEPLFRQVLEIRRRALGENHPGYAQDISGLDDAFEKKGNYEAAEALLRQALRNAS